jgi:glutathione S-transferase
MIYDDAHRRACDAENQAHAANARAATAAEARDRLREDVRRLEKELSTTASIAGELFSTLLAADPQLAGCVSQSVLSQYGNYRESQEFPNISELLARLARAR